MPAEQREFWLQTDALGHPPRVEIYNGITDSMMRSLDGASGAADDEGPSMPEGGMSPISIQPFL